MSDSKKGSVTGNPLAVVAILVAGVLFVYFQTRSTASSVEEEPTGLALLATQVGGWRCTAPAGAEGSKPLYYLKAGDSDQLSEARERIELIKRRGKMDWKDAAWRFSQEQSVFNTSYKFMPENQRRAALSVQNAIDGKFTMGGTPENYVAELKSQYDKDCKDSNGYRKAMLKEEPERIALRAEKDKPWMSEKNKLPCTVADVDNCMK
jgi:hypothetical protein